MKPRCNETAEDLALAQTCDEARDQVVMSCIPLIQYVITPHARRMPPCVGIEDVFQDGILGLMDAIEKYDPCHSANFATYATQRIRGAALDALRGLDWIPRSLREKERAIAQAEEHLIATLGRLPDDDALANSLHIDLDTLHDWRRLVDGFHMMSLEAYYASEKDGHGLTLDKILPNTEPAPPDAAYLNECKALLATAIAELPARQKIVLSLYYHEELTMAEIGAVLGRTESRVSQIHTAAIRQLRKTMGKVLA